MLRRSHSDRRSLARLHREHRQGPRSIRSKVWDWYQTYEPLDLNFWVAWRRVPEIVQSLREIDDLDDIDDAHLQVIAWFGSALTAQEQDPTDLGKEVYRRARRLLRRTTALVEELYECVGTESPSVRLELLNAQGRLREAGELLVTKNHRHDRSARIAGRLQAGGSDVLSYLVMRVLTAGDRLPKSRAEVLVARMGRVFGWEVGSQTTEVGGRDESPAIRKRVERFRASPRWLVSAPWQVLLWDTLEIPPDRFGEEGAPLALVTNVEAAEKVALKVNTDERYFDVVALSASLEDVKHDTESVWLGFDREFDRLAEDIRDHRSRMDTYQEEFLNGLRRDPTHCVALKRAEHDWAEEREVLKDSYRTMRMVARALKQPEEDYQAPEMPRLAINLLEPLADRVRKSRLPEDGELMDLERRWRAEKEAIELLVTRERILNQAIGVPGADDDLTRPVFPTYLGLRTLLSEK